MLCKIIEGFAVTLEQGVTQKGPIQLLCLVCHLGSFSNNVMGLKVSFFVFNALCDVWT